MLFANKHVIGNNNNNNNNNSFHTFKILLKQLATMIMNILYKTCYLDDQDDNDIQDWICSDLFFYNQTTEERGDQVDNDSGIMVTIERSVEQRAIMMPIMITGIRVVVTVIVVERLAD
ncbi:hypothetical protein DINM_007328 [Dirofilaria immitis]|nr:hypothetical protein [Dirofilaria immitis]